jgi:hypothetical protein
VSLKLRQNSSKRKSRNRINLNRAVNLICSKNRKREKRKLILRKSTQEGTDLFDIIN